MVDLQSEINFQSKYAGQLHFDGVTVLPRCESATAFRFAKRCLAHAAHAARPARRVAGGV